VNKQNIIIFNYIYSSYFETEKSDDVKWEELKVICQNSTKQYYFSFYEDNAEFLEVNSKCIVRTLSEPPEIIGKFIKLSVYGKEAYLNYKIEEVRDLIRTHDNQAFKHRDELFANMCNEAIREILTKCKYKRLIDFIDSSKDSETAIYYADDTIHCIIFENVRVLDIEQVSEDSASAVRIENYISQSGKGNILQTGSNSMASISISNDEDLFKILAEKYDALFVEMENKNCKQELENLKVALAEKNKTKVVEIVNVLVSLGSFICAAIQIFM